MGLANAEATVRLPDGVALHARPAGLFVRTAAGFRSRVTVVAGPKQADAKSILAVMALGAEGGASLVLRAEGEDAEAAVAALASCVAGFAE
ncbi:MAG TPA: HPr family phosphocarrier protein [Candidatus Dormibacteraeota bacterium]|nr:HPr family phosphocarrier protein [Candidatus Dormibacteraeota bacterium]